MEKPKKRPFFSTTLFVAIGRSGGLILPFFIAMLYGAGRTTDAFFFAYGLIFAFLGMFTYVFESASLPYLIERKSDPGQMAGFANGVFLASFPAILLISAALYLSIPFVLTRWSGWDAASSRLVGKLFLEMLPLLIFGTWIASLNSLFYADQIFWFPAISPLVRFLILIGMVLTMRQRLGTHALTSGFVAGETVRWGLSVFLVWRLTKWRWQIHWAQVGPEVRKFLKGAVFLMLGLSAGSFILIGDQWFASRLESGDLTLLNYADRLLQIPYLLLLSGVLQIFLADWSDQYCVESSAVFWSRIQRDLRIAFCGGLILGGGIWLLRSPLVCLLYGHGSLSAKQLETLAEILGWLAISFVPGLMRLLYVRMLFVIKKSVFYFYQSWAELMLKLLANYFLMRWFGVRGIAMSTALVYFLTALWFYFYFSVHFSKKVQVP